MKKTRFIEMPVAVHEGTYKSGLTDWPFFHEPVEVEIGCLYGHDQAIEEADAIYRAAKGAR